jgi:hypothetical protein
VRNLPDEIRDRRVRFETHPLHAKFAFLVADDKRVSDVSSGSHQAWLQKWKFRCDGTGALFFALCEIGTNSTVSLPGLKPRPRGRTLEARSQTVLHWFWHKADSECMTGYPDSDTPDKLSSQTGQKWASRRSLLMSFLPVYGPCAAC